MNNLPTHALSVRQPWADLILFNTKRVENRTWRIPDKWVGVPVYLHAGKKPEPFDHYDFMYQPYPASLQVRLGAILGIVTFGRAFQPKEPKREWEIGPWCWPITEVNFVLANPIPYRGMLGFFPVTLPQRV